MSFLIDPFLLIFFGVLINLVGKKKYKEDSFLKPALSVLCLSVFYFLSGLLLCGFNAQDHGVFGVINDTFFDVLRVMWASYYENNPDGTSTEFMFSSGFEILRPPFTNLEGLAKHPIYLFAAVWMFVIYPVWLYLGIKLGVFLFGKEPGDKGFIGML